MVDDCVNVGVGDKVKSEAEKSSRRQLFFTFYKSGWFQKKNIHCVLLSIQLLFALRQRKKRQQDNGGGSGGLIL